MAVKLNELTLAEALARVEQGETSASEIWQACRKEINSRDKDIKAFLSVGAEDLPKNTDEKAELRGLPLGVKDNFCTTDYPTTASALLLEDFKSPYDAEVITRLREKGASIIGKTNLDAWAHGSSTETSDFGPTHNPRNLAYEPGGSSGGSAAAVAADFCLAALGSETAGSIRLPAALCGTVGFRPTYGRISRFGAVAMASSMDCPGFLTKTVEDSAILADMTLGGYRRDATSLRAAVPDLRKVITAARHDLQSSNQPLKGLKIGVQYLDLAGLEAYTTYYEDIISLLEKLGAQVEKVKSLDPRLAIAVYTVIQRSEVSSNLARYDGVRYGKSRDTFGLEARRRIMLGTYTLSKGFADKYYLLAQKVRTLFINDYQKLFKKYDLLIGPTYPGFALKLGESSKSAIFGELEDMLMEPSSLTGLPSMTVPCYRDSETNLYLGLNIMGKLLDESSVIRLGEIYEQSTHWNSWREKEKEK